MSAKMSSDIRLINSNEKLQNSDRFFGWDLLYKTIGNIVAKEADVLIVLVHYVIIRESKFRCIGVGEDKTLSEDEIGLELLPEGWNDDENKYALRYAYNNQLLLLLGHIADDMLVINLLDVKTKRVSNIGLAPKELVLRFKGTLNAMIPCAADIMLRYRKELIEPVLIGTTKESITQTNFAQCTPLLLTTSVDHLGRYPIINTMGPRPWVNTHNVVRGESDQLGRYRYGNLVPFFSQPEFRGRERPRFNPYASTLDRNTFANSNPNLNTNQPQAPPNFNSQTWPLQQRSLLAEPVLTMHSNAYQEEQPQPSFSVPNWPSERRNGLGERVLPIQTNYNQMQQQQQQQLQQQQLQQQQLQPPNFNSPFWPLESRERASATNENLFGRQATETILQNDHFS